ncbi:MAG TPA: pirin family protein [Myxococcales bacterium]
MLPRTAGESPPELTLVAPSKDLGGFRVRRALPSVQRRMVSSFVFFDQMGPAVFEKGRGLDVRPHPHIGLATVTYLFEGQILHRDSLGTVQRIEPGEVNWMTAGRGIVHSERTAKDVRANGGNLFGIQLWVALPKAQEEIEPSFRHVGAGELPLIEDPGVSVRVVLGSLFGAKSPVPLLSKLFYAAASLDEGARLPLPDDAEERAVYIAEGAAEVAGERFETGALLVFRPGDSAHLRAAAPKTRLLLLGGDAADGPRHIHWNFVSSSAERIEVAKADWRAQRFGQVPGETEFIPLPDEPKPVRYP